MKTLIQTLTQVPGPSGYEHEIRAAVEKEIAAHADDYRVDALGNLIARKGSANASGLKIMLSAHMDEIGVIASHIDENGFVRFTNIGGVYPRNCVGGHVRFMNGTRGVIGLERVTNSSEVPPLEKMYIDTGAASRETCTVSVGDVAVFERTFLDLGDRLVSKAMDDRISVAILVETLRRLKNTPHQVYFVFSTQEEIGTRGAATAAYGVNPDIGLAVDVTLSGDTPKGIKMEVHLGKGPAIKVRDGGMLADPRVVDWMVCTAEAAGLPYQREVLLGGTTDARSIQVARAGVPAGCLSVPCRYVHTPSEMVDYRDVQHSVDLLLALLENPVTL
ncbi:MAG: M42 family metallopeptidase [Anaerolineales bacterium]